MARTKNAKSKEFSPLLATEIQLKEVGWLKPYERNSRTHSETQIFEIMRSIEEFGFTNPILAQSSGTIIAGHGRLEAANRLGLDQVPVIILDHLSEKQARALVIADNKISDNSGWDMETLAYELNELRMLDFDLEITGYDQHELDEILEPYTREEDEEEEKPEQPEQDIEMPEIPVSTLGDVWLLGNHRLMCGDSTNQKNIDVLLQSKKASMVFTDPPYNMDFDGGLNRDGSKSRNADHKKIINDKMTEEEAEEFFFKVNKIIKNNLEGAFYITFYRLGIGDYLSSMRKAGLKDRSLIIWSKGNTTLSNRDYKSTYEPIFYGWVGKHRFYGGNVGRDIWNISRTAVNDLHPTMKPVELVEKAINDASVVRDTVLDLFGGSGTTLIACENRKRHARIIELDPLYCDVAVKRWQYHTGKKAKLESSGKTFAAMDKERNG